MKLRIARSLWGLVRGDGGSLGAGEAVERLAATGAEAIECSLALAHALGARELRDALRANGLAWVPICFSSGPLGDQDVFPEVGALPTWRTLCSVVAAHIHASAIMQPLGLNPNDRR